MKLACIPLFIGACVLVYFGSAMLLFVPPYPGEGYFSSARILNGVLPAMASAGLLTLVGWLWARSGRPGNLKKSLKVTYSLAYAAIALLWLGLMIIGGIRQG